MNCVDLSSSNSKVDFKVLKRLGVNNVILRDGYGWGDQGKKDKKLDAFYQQANNANIQVGYYHYCYSVDEMGMIEEAKAALNNIGNKYCSIVACDIERPEHAKMTGVELTALVKAFAGVIEKAGKIPFVYMNKAMMDKLNFQLLPAILGVWLAWWGAEEIKVRRLPYHVHIWQSDVIGTSRECTLKGTLPGIKGNVDIDTIYTLPNDNMCCCAV